MPRAGTDKTGYGYALFRISGREALVYVVECDKQDKAMLEAAHVEIRGQIRMLHRQCRRPGRVLCRAEAQRSAVPNDARLAYCSRPSTIVFFSLSSTARTWRITWSATIACPSAVGWNAPEVSAAKAGWRMSKGEMPSRCVFAVRKA